MKNLDATILLKQLILEKESEKELRELLLKDQFRATFESLKPINIIKNTFKQIVTSPEIKTSIINSAIGFISGFVAKKLFVGGSNNPIKKMGGSILGTLVANKTEANAENIKSAGSLLLKKVIELYYAKKQANGGKQ
ncbi:MAG: hypothetical protein Q8M29_15705 [Bacteroidota bacterium]|nr:hypothetical protein [Bacteroidota bacterium]